MPERIQRKRSKGWKMPDNMVYVGRPTKYGNPFKPGMRLGDCSYVIVQRSKYLYCDQDMELTLEMCLDLFKLHALRMKARGQLDDLRGKNLACWCKIGEPCHADVLLKLANE